MTIGKHSFQSVLVYLQIYKITYYKLVFFCFCFRVVPTARKPKRISVLVNVPYI